MKYFCLDNLIFSFWFFPLSLKFLYFVRQFLYFFEILFSKIVDRFDFFSLLLNTPFKSYFYLLSLYIILFQFYKNGEYSNWYICTTFFDSKNQNLFEKYRLRLIYLNLSICWMKWDKYWWYKLDNKWYGKK